MRVRWQRVIFYSIILTSSVTLMLVFRQNMSGYDNIKIVSSRRSEAMDFQWNFTITSTQTPSANITIKTEQTMLGKIAVPPTQKKSESSLFPGLSDQCKDIVFPKSLQRHEKWSQVDANRTLYVYSGYVNVRGLRIVTIVGAITSSANQFYCQLWYTDTGGNPINMTTVLSSNRKYHHSRERYVATELTCTLQDDRLPQFVSVVSSKCSTPLHLLVLKRPPDSPYRYNFTMCIAPLNIRYGRAYELVEWIEFNRILGADHFIFYNYSIRPNVDRVLRHYMERGLVEVLPWQLPMHVHTWPPSPKPTEIQYFGQTMQLNECLLRCKKHTKYVVNSDLDEFPVPHEEDVFTWHELVQKYPGSYLYMFRNAFFRKEWESNVTFIGINFARKFQLTTLLKSKREETIWPQGQRSKYIALTENTKTLQVHTAAVEGGLAQVRVLDPTQGLLHHYRNCMENNDTQPQIEDKMVLRKYKDMIISRVYETWSQLKGVELDIPI